MTQRLANLQNEVHIQTADTQNHGTKVPVYNETLPKPKPKPTGAS